MFNSWWSTLITQQAAGTALSASTTATSLLNGQAKFTLPAQGLAFPGSKLKIHASGRMSTAASTPGTFTFDIRFGSIVVFNGGASGTLATSASNVTWRLNIDLVALTVGSGTTATLYGTGELKTAALSATTPLILLPASSPAAGTGFDSTVANAVDLFGTWSVNSASNSIRCDEFELTSCFP
jgi:hypothetical protein